MNHVFKVVWCNICNCWVVASEFAKNHGKSKSRVATNAFIITSILNISSLAFALPQQITGGFTIPQIKTGDEFLIKGAQGNIDANVLGNASSTVILLKNQSDKPLKVDMENSTLFIRNTGQGTIGQLNGFEARGTSGVEVNLKGFNTIYMENSNTADTALQVNSGTLTEQGKGGNAILNIEGSLNIYTKGNKGGFERDGIEVNAYNGNVILNHAGSGAIQTSAGNAVYAKQRAGNGNVVINLNSLSGKDNIVLITAGDSKGPSAWMGNHGISAAITLANTIGNINVFSNAKISTTGKGAKGIYSHHNGIGENNIENQGTILTVSDNAYGIHALANNSNSKGQNFIANQGDITTNGIKATGIFNENRSLGNNLINNTGTILTTGNEAYTIHSVNSNVNSAGNMVITNSGNLTTQGTDADGINVNNAGLKTV